MDLNNYFGATLLEIIYLFAFILIFSIGFISIISTSLTNTKFKKIAFYLLSILIVLAMQISVVKNVVDSYMVWKLIFMDSIFFLLGAMFCSKLSKHKLLQS